MSGPYGSALLSLLVVGAGVSVALQQVLNANLRGQLDSSWWAGFISYLVGMLAMLVVALGSGEPLLSRVRQTSWISWGGGICGAFFISTAIFTVPRFGAATVLTLIVVGQMVGSLAFDHFGLFGVPQHSINLGKLLGAAFLILGVVLVRR
jgi:transporter family-2 protein